MAPDTLAPIGSGSDLSHARCQAIIWITDDLLFIFIIILLLTLAGQTAQHIADRLDCWISTIRWIRKGIRKLVADKDCQVVVVERRPQPVMSAILEGL